MQQRYYDPVIGRFYSDDPVGFNAQNPMMFNRYIYGNNNPYKYIDPDGRATVGGYRVSISGGIPSASRRKGQDVDEIYKSFGVNREDNQALNSPVGDAPVSSPFRASRSCNQCSKDHPGTDYRVPIGTDVRATAAGTVVRANRSASFGNLVIVDHGELSSGIGHLYTLYAHGSSVSVKSGQQVEMGKVIMKSGNTGNSTGPHLHYEVIKTSYTPNHKEFYNNINIRYAPSDLISK